jgi:hypothetical protein
VPIAVNYDQAGGRTLVRGSFEIENAEQEAAVSAHIFSASTAWVNEEYRYDGYLRSAFGVLVVILSVGLGNPSWLRRYSQHSKPEQVAKLVPGITSQPCFACGAELLVGTAACESCGALQTVDVPSRADTSPRSRPEDRSWTELLLPVALVVLSLSLWAGYRPVVEAFASVVPMQRWEKVTHQTRLGMLTQAYFRVETLEQELEGAIARGRPIDESWGRRLWEVGRDYKLMDEKIAREETEELERTLQDALTALDRTRRAYEPGAGDDPNVTAALDVARTNLERAGELLQIPRTDRR